MQSSIFTGGRDRNEPRRPWPPPRPVRIVGTLALIVLAAACAAGGAAPIGEPVPDPTASAAAVARQTTPAERRQITFAWTLDESGSRVRGRGVVRLQPPDRLRLDLFGPRNETVLAAAMVGDEARFPGGARPAVAVPSPALLWAGIGAVRPPGGAVLQGVTSTGEETVLRYEVQNGEVYEYRVSRAPEPRLLQLQRIGPRGPLETVRLDRTPTGTIERANYRDWSEFRDLTLEIEESVAAPPFPDDIWTP